MSSRLFAIGIAGPRLTDVERGILRDEPPYGVILFRRNIQDAEQLRELIAELKRLSVRFLFVDQEGGPVDRLAGVLAPTPSFQSAARGGRARRLGELAGAALAALGFDVDLAPVVDRGVADAGALVLGERCASADPGEVLRAGAEFLDGLHTMRIGGCLKHFPGLGRARLDTHKSLPLLEPDPHQEALDLAPFDGLMARARAIMVSHAAGPDGVPASLSRERATRLLRERIGFEGAAFSDDLEMGALDSFGDLPERCAQASAAGCDLLFVCRQIERYMECVSAVEKSVPVARRAEAAQRLEEYAGHLAALRAAAGAPVPTPEIVAAQLRELTESLA
ncbi:MAG: glycoside hydrolase family 3 N-terminal domain-containing protein [Acidobacteriota bacterium]